MTDTAILGITLIDESQSQKATTANEAFARLEQGARKGFVVADKDLTTPPGGESEGDAYIFLSGTWDGNGTADDIAIYFNGGYIYVTPTEGVEAEVLDEGITYKFTSGAWAVKSYSTGFIFDNNVFLQGKDTGGTAENLIGMNSSDIVEIGDAGHAAQVVASSLLIDNPLGVDGEGVPASGLAVNKIRVGDTDDFNSLDTEFLNVGDYSSGGAALARFINSEGDAGIGTDGGDLGLYVGGLQKASLDSSGNFQSDASMAADNEPTPSAGMAATELRIGDTDDYNSLDTEVVNVGDYSSAAIQRVRIINSEGYVDYCSNNGQAMIYVDNLQQLLLDNSALEIPNANVYLNGSNPILYGNDTDGVLTITPDTSSAQGANIELYGNTHATLAKYFYIRTDASDALEMTDAGEFTMPRQPSFNAWNEATDSNVTGNATAATVDFSGERFDQNADFASDTFTAPVTGKYLLTVALRVSGITAAADSYNIYVITSNATYQHFNNDINDLPATGYFSASVVVDMDAGDTAHIELVGAGEASDVWDIYGAASSYQTYFSGCLLC